MATITSAGSGNWSAGATWVGGVAPTSADGAVIANGHTVTLDGARVASSVTVNVGGTLTCSTTVSTSLTVQTNVIVNGNCTLDVSSDPSVVCEVILNNAASTATPVGTFKVVGDAAVSLKGAPRKRTTRLVSGVTAGATSATVQDASGWRVGDTVVFATTQAYNVTPRTDVVTLTSVSGGLIGWSGGLAYDHAANGYVGNFSSNMVLRPAAPRSVSQVWLDHRFKGKAGTKLFDNVLFKELSGSSYFEASDVAFAINQEGGSYSSSLNLTVSNSAFYEYGKSALYNGAYAPAVFNTVIFYSANVGAAANTCFRFDQGRTPGSESSYAGIGIYRHTGTSAAKTGMFFSDAGGSLSNSFFSAVQGPGLVLYSGLATLDSVEVFACETGLAQSVGIANGRNIQIGTHNGGVATNSVANTHSFLCQATLTDSDAQTLSLTGLSTSASQHELTFINRGNDPTRQEIYRPFCEIKRNNVTVNRGASSISIKPTKLATASQRTQSIPCANGATIRVVGYVRMDTAFWNAGDCNLPNVTLTGIGATPVTFTASAAANNAWEQFDLSITNTSGADGNFVLTYTANAKTVSTGTVYFDGVPDSPFVTKVRHYGFLFNETIPTLTANPYTVATESVAAAYTGTTINATTKRVTFGVGTADTLNKVYDYSQAWAVLNIDKEVPWTRAGALLSLTSGWTMVDPAIAGVTWGGGTIEWNTPGAITGSFDSTTFRFNSAGTYDLSGGTFAGTINLTNTSGGGVIVIVLPSGIDYVNDDPGSITVEVAVESATASITNIVPGSRLQVYNVTEDTEMVNTIVAGTSWTASYPNGTGYSTGDVVRVRLAYCSGLDAKLPLQVSTVAASGGWTILADQQDDEVYILNGIDGSAVTEYASDYVNVQIDISDPDAVTTIQRGYAWYADQMTGDDGIRYFYGAMVAEDALNYLLDTDVADIKVQNTNMSVGVSLTGGALRRKDGSSPIAPGGSVYIYYGRTYGLETGVSGLTPTESDRLMQTALETTALAAKNNAALAAALSA